MLFTPWSGAAFLCPRGRIVWMHFLKSFVLACLVGCSLTTQQVAELSLESARETGNTAWAVTIQLQQAQQEAAIAPFYIDGEPREGVTEPEVQSALAPIRARHRRAREILQRATETHARAVDAYNLAVAQDSDFTETLALLARAKELFQQYQEFIQEQN